MTKKKKRTDPNWSAMLGYGCAHLQDMMDEIADWGFQKIREVGEQKPKKSKKANKYVRTANKAIHTILQFLGNAGEAYYERYEDLKKKKK